MKWIKNIALVIVSGCIFFSLGAYIGRNQETISYIDGTASGLQYQYLSGEVEAMQRQAYNMAMEKLEEAVKTYRNTKNLAVVLDLDETVINNYGCRIEDFISGEGYTAAKWDEWTTKEKATLIPGAYDFLQKAKELKVDIYYVSNRIESQKARTISNLKKLNIPNADKEHVLTKTDTWEKNKRFAEVKKTKNVIMYVGDNLNDFPIGTYHKSNEARKKMVSSKQEKFGTEYIILPNAVYGDWSSATYQYNGKKADKDKVKSRIDALEQYKKQQDQD